MCIHKGNKLYKTSLYCNVFYSFESSVVGLSAAKAVCVCLNVEINMIALFFRCSVIYSFFLCCYFFKVSFKRAFLFLKQISN